MRASEAERSAAEGDELVIPPRFCGPPGTGNGGYVAGRLAGRTGARGPVEVTLRRPAPLETPLAVVWAQSPATVWTLAAAGGPVAEARLAPGALDLEPAVRPRPGAVAAAPPPADHAFPGCFVCGPARAPGDGLRLLPGPVPGAGRAAGYVAAPWTPPADLADARGEIEPAIVWASLDCPGYFACMGGGPLRPMLLGRITAALEAPVLAGEPHVVIAWPLVRSGRRHEAATALLDAHGRILARSRQVWIAPRAA